MTRQPESISQVAEFATHCRRAGIKATRQRHEIYRELTATDEHPDAETLCRRVRRRMPTVSLDTVYRNLHTLETCGMVRRLGLPGTRTRYDGDTRRHHHIVCTRCGRISDFTSSEFDALQAPEPIRREWTGIEAAQVELRGLCPVCSEHSRAASPLPACGCAPAGEPSIPPPEISDRKTRNPE